MLHINLRKTIPYINKYNLKVIFKNYGAAHSIYKYQLFTFGLINEYVLWSLYFNIYSLSRYLSYKEDEYELICVVFRIAI